VYAEAEGVNAELCNTYYNVIIISLSVYEYNLVMTRLACCRETVEDL
jgi:hypothetical protein